MLFRSTGATKVEMNFTITQLQDGTFQYGINGKPHWATKPFVAKLGETQIWKLVNKTPWSHPFHLHGYFFQVVDEQGRPVGPNAYKDTLNIPMKTTARLLVTFDDRPGQWMFHCHILDHAEGGLMGTVAVGDIDVKGHEVEVVAKRADALAFFFMRVFVVCIFVSKDTLSKFRRTEKVEL